MRRARREPTMSVRGRAAVLFLVGAAAAQDAPGFEDDFWNVTYRARALRLLLAPADPAVLLKARCAGDLTVTLTVHEAAEELDAEAWRKRFRAEWEKKGRKLEAVEEKAGRIVFEEPKLGVFRAHHGYRFVPRGLHCFEVHAWIDDRTEGSAAALAEALEGIEVGPDPGCGLVAARHAQREGRPATDPRVLLDAGIEYLAGQRYGQRNPALAAALLVRARGAAKEDTFDAEGRWKLLRYGGEALVAAGRAKEAVSWLADAEAAATPERAPETAYALARACTVAEDLDGAFAALDRAFSGDVPPADKARLSKEKELEPLRRDPRWEDFWKRRVR